MSATVFRGCLLVLVLFNCCGQSQNEQCTIDHLLKFVTDVLPAGSVEVNNQFIGALRQVAQAIETSKGIPSNIRVDKTVLIDRIKKSVDGRKGQTYGRKMLGFVLQKHLHCGHNGIRVIREVKDALGDDRFKDLLAVNGDVSLIFTLDTTGSMSQEIPQAKALAKTLNGYRRKGKVEYILSTYNDPGCGPVRTFNKKEKRKFDAAINRLYAYGGGDCQEPTFEGIINAIDYGAPYTGSPMYVFTDSPSKTKGYRNSDAAIGLARDNIMNINFFFSRYGCANPLKDTNYDRTMDDTGGLGLFFPTPLSFYKAEDILKADLDGTVIICSGGFNRNSGTIKQRIEFPVDRTIRRLIISMTAVSNSSGVNLLDSRGNVLGNRLAMFEGALWIVDNPINGTWALVMNSWVSQLSYIIKASSTSNIDFEHIFVRRAKPYNQLVQITNPLQGERARAKIIIPQLSRLNKETLQLQLVNKNGTAILPLVFNNNEVAFDLPGTNSFRMLLTGRTVDGDKFMRTSVTIRPLSVILRTQILHDLMNIKRGRISYFRAMIDSSSEKPRVFRLVGSSFTRGIKLTMRRTVRVTKSRPGYIPVFVVTRFKVPVGTVARIQITAISNDVTVNLIESLMVT